ncbi:ubiquinol-cytochrome c reductase cytochrome c1 subunit [Luteibacter rhizovicinus]|uniref:Ubiquinol-cytochrome c reductase cytochrome c1 subunit n=1 Tax=Luteibacter rhizovicinus TaxID=242606 RepID=A0A4R3YQ64_9GAMM|nr:cytochrome c1 [Luteibacter rhizovicinus]TCV94927.1 ubiquinol-cytochrome c reductase cytochrome c1 subunit [Luteibacter rhizovicinus]
MTKRYFSSIALAFGLLVGSVSALANEGGAELPTAGTNVSDKASLQRGAKLFFNYCVGCHSLKYVRYSRMASDLGLSEDEVMNNLNFTGAKFGEPVISHMPAESAKSWFGKDPPDLSLEARAKGVDWIYNYLNSFYLDPTRPVGWNNTVFPNASMPNPLWELQGIQVAVHSEATPGHDASIEKLELSQPGRMTPEQFRGATRDLTTFLEYAAEPAALERQSIGVWVLLFLAGFTFLAYLLKHEYWKDVH